MSYKYFTVLTDVGKQKLAEAIANETALDFTEMAVGDSNGTSYEPTSDMTALKHVTYRAAIGSMKINAEDKNIMEFEFVVPASTGGFYVREAGLYSSDGTLIAISRLPEQYKADMAEGAGSSMTVRILVAISSDAQIYITVPASITYATKTYVTEEFKKHKADSNPHGQYVLNKTYSAKIDELQEDIASKAANTHNHDSTYLKKTDASNIYATQDELTAGLADKAASNHTHSNYAANSHSHDFSSITGSMDFADNRLKGLLPISKGGTNSHDGFGWKNLMSWEEFLSKIGLSSINQPFTIQQIIDAIQNKNMGDFHISFSFWGADLICPGISYGGASSNIMTIKKISSVYEFIFCYGPSNDIFRMHTNNATANNFYAIMIGNGSIPAEIISPTVLKYENSDGSWTETKLNTGEVMLEGYDTFTAQRSSLIRINIPKNINISKSKSIQITGSSSSDITAIINFDPTHNIAIINNSVSTNICYWYFRGILA